MSKLRAAKEVIFVSRDPFEKVALLTGLVVLFAASCYMLPKKEFNGLTATTPLDYLYFASVTLSTVGYGDVSPKSRRAKALTLLFVAASTTVMCM